MEFRYFVASQRYSLAAGTVGENRGPLCIHSRHRARKAAGNRLASLISGKRRKELQAVSIPFANGEPVGVRVGVMDKRHPSRGIIPLNTFRAETD
jgi:hypothetical protein